MVKRRSRSTSTGIPDMRFCSASPGGATASRRSKYFRGRMCGKTSIFTVGSAIRPLIYSALASSLRGGRLSSNCDPLPHRGRGIELSEGPCTVPVVALHGVVPEQLPPRRLRDGGPAQDDVHRLREPALRMRVVGGEHERVFAQRLQGVAERLLTLVELDALEILRPTDVLARLLLERRQGVARHLGQLVQ